MRAVFEVGGARADRDDRRADLLDAALEPFVRRVLDHPRSQMPVDVVVGEGGAVWTHRRLDQFDAVRIHSRGNLLRDPVRDNAFGATDLQQPRMIRMRAGVSVDRWRRRRTWRKKSVDVEGVFILRGFVYNSAC